MELDYETIKHLEKWIDCLIKNYNAMADKIKIYEEYEHDIKEKVIFLETLLGDASGNPKCSVCKKPIGHFDEVSAHDLYVHEGCYKADIK